MPFPLYIFTFLLVIDWRTMFTEDKVNIYDIPSKLLPEYNSDPSMNICCTSPLDNIGSSWNVAHKSILSVSMYEHNKIQSLSFSRLCMKLNVYIHLYPHFYTQPFSKYFLSTWIKYWRYNSEQNRQNTCFHLNLHSSGSWVHQRI